MSTKFIATVILPDPTTAKFTLLDAEDSTIVTLDRNVHSIGNVDLALIAKAGIEQMFNTGPCVGWVVRYESNIETGGPNLIVFEFVYEY